MAKKIQTYQGENITVHFDASRCMHAGKCVHDLPEVFRPESRGRWIFPDAADVEALSEMIATCPSGALTYVRMDVSKSEKKPEVNSISVMPGGPLYVHADMEIHDVPEPSYRAALCRCGASCAPPYCDGAHKSAGFKDGSGDFSGQVEEISINGCLSISTVSDGPLLIKGGCQLRDIKGTVFASHEQFVLCRCGASANKPYCDGSHVGINFKAD